MKETCYTVIGAGHGGKAMAADLAARGFTVHLYNRSAERINEIALRGEVELEYEDGTHRLARLAAVTSDIAEALDGTDVIIVLPASGHRDVARLCAPHLRGALAACFQQPERFKLEFTCVSFSDLFHRPSSDSSIHDFAFLHVHLFRGRSRVIPIVMRPSGEETVLNNQDEELPVGAIFVRES